MRGKWYWKSSYDAWWIDGRPKHGYEPTSPRLLSWWGRMGMRDALGVVAFLRKYIK